MGRDYGAISTPEPGFMLRPHDLRPLNFPKFVLHADTDNVS